VQQVADRDPGRIARIVYVDTGPLVDGAVHDSTLPEGTSSVPLPSWAQLAAQGASIEGIADLEAFRERAAAHPGNVATEPVRVSGAQPAAQGPGIEGTADLAAFRERAAAHPGKVATEPVRVSDPARLDVPATFVCCSIPSAVLRENASREAPFHTELGDVRDATWVDLPTGHWPMLSRPADLAAVLVDAARA